MIRRRSTILAAAGLVLFLGLWEAAPRLGWLNPTLLPPPSALPAAWWRELASNLSPAQRADATFVASALFTLDFWQRLATGVWIQGIIASLSHYLLGLMIGVSLGVAIGVATGMFRPAEETLSWVTRVLRPIPGLAWVPFAIIWFGVNTPAALFIIAVGCFWIVYFAAHGAVRAVDRDLIEVADAFGFRSAPARLRKIVLPAATPGILVGLRTAIGQAWMAVVAAEIFGVPGLGQRMVQASALLATDIVVVYMLTIAALYGLINSAFVRTQNWLLRWKP